MTKILITGANGQLGSELRNLLDERGIAYDAFDSKQLDITDQAVVNEKISALEPEVIYHCAAYTAVDNAEDVAKDLNWQVNVDGTRNVAEAAKRVGAKMVYISTDYVFDGANEGEYEVDAVIPEMYSLVRDIESYAHHGHLDTLLRFLTLLTGKRAGKTHCVYQYHIDQTPLSFVILCFHYTLSRRPFQ